jgi:hypothetical protein
MVKLRQIDFGGSQFNEENCTMKIRKMLPVNKSRSLSIAQTQVNIRFCQYLAADLIELSQSVPFVEAGLARQLSEALTRWADHMTRTIEDIHQGVDSSEITSITRSSAP